MDAPGRLRGNPGELHRMDGIAYVIDGNVWRGKARDGNVGRWGTHAFDIDPVRIEQALLASATAGYFNSTQSGEIQ